eukprot:3757041-Prorocentrum_lima.AAC.1
MTSSLVGSEMCIRDRYRVAGSPPNFTVPLTEGIQVPDHTAAVITERTISSIWGSIIDNVNNVFYFVQAEHGLNADRHMSIIPSKTCGNSLASGLET